MDHLVSLSKSAISKNRFIIIIPFIFLMFSCSSAISTDQIVAMPEVIKSTLRYSKEYTLQAGDQVEVYVYRQPDFSKVGTIRPDGFLTLPILDDLKAAGLAPMDLDKIITERLSERLINPEVTVFVQNVVEPMVYVHGEVAVAAAIPLRQAKTVAQALALVSGVKRSGNLSQVAIIRLTEDGFLKALTIDDSGSGQAANYLAMQNMPLLPEDIIFVPENGRSQFTRAVQDFVNTPLGGLNQILAPYFQFRLLAEIEED